MHFKMIIWFDLKYQKNTKGILLAQKLHYLIPDLSPLPSLP